MVAFLDSLDSPSCGTSAPLVDCSTQTDAVPSAQPQLGTSSLDSPNSATLVVDCSTQTDSVPSAQLQVAPTSPDSPTTAALVVDWYTQMDAVPSAQLQTQTDNEHIAPAVRVHKRKHSEAESAGESSSKRTRLTERSTEATSVRPVTASTTQPSFSTSQASLPMAQRRSTVVKPPAQVERRRTGRRAYDLNGMLHLNPYEDEENLLEPDIAMQMPTRPMSIQRRLEYAAEIIANREWRRKVLAQNQLQQPSDDDEQQEGPKQHQQQQSAAQNTIQDHSNLEAEAYSHPNQIAHEANDIVQTSDSTPSNRLWGLASFMGSVSRYVPSFRRPPLPVPEIYQNHATNASIPDRMSDADTNLPQAPTTSLGTKNERYKLHKKSHKSKSKSSKRDVASMAFHEKEIADEVARRVTKEVNEALQQQKLANPGEKRKRYSPDGIPNPPGCSYGLDPAFFGSDSGSEEGSAEEYVESPSARPTKRARLSLETPTTSQMHIIGDPNRARPYVGTMFAKPKPTIFKTALKSASSTVNKTVTFAVPDDSESETDEVTATTKGKGKATEAPFSTTISIESLQQPPTPRPSHAALPSVNASPVSPATAVISTPATTPILTTGDTEALARARSQALRYTPVKPSGLREASRLSSSTIATPSDNGGDDVNQSVSETPAISTMGNKGVSQPVSEAPLTSAVNSNDVIQTVSEIPALYTMGNNNVNQSVTETSRVHTVGNNDVGQSVVESPVPNTIGNNGVDQSFIERSISYDIGGNNVDPTALEVHTVLENVLRDISGNTNMIDPEVAAAINAVPESDLMSFTFPAAEMIESDADVDAELEKNWTEWDENRAHQVWNRQLGEFIGDQTPPI
ncbi:hypothetical protein MMC19_002824 [Ptychographa xylographoides]|nr:hypothetical protein [Ptychographa xylographoides]